MAFLTVLGTGTWGFADSQRRMRTFDAGVHEVDDEVVAMAQAAGDPRLVVTDVEPIIRHRDPSEGPLSWDDIRLPADGGVEFAAEAQQVEAAHEKDPFALPLDYPCGTCPARFPAPAPRDRHRALHHGADPPGPATAAREPDLSPEAAPEVVRQVPQGVHPTEAEDPAPVDSES